MTNYLEVTNLSKSFDSFQLHNISFTLPKGYIMGLIGPNGSGKTTTIKLILNMSILICSEESRKSLLSRQLLGWNKEQLHLFFSWKL